MPDGMIQKERKKRIIKQTAMKAILVIILVCIAMITFLLLFQVRKIEVSGNQYLSRQEIADWVQDDNWSSNSLYVMIRNHLMNHELLPAMEEANVTMKNPWTVKVTIKEKRVAGYIVSGDECIYFDKDGIVLAKTKELWDMTMTLKKCDLAPDKIVCSGSDLYLFFGNKCVNVGHTNLEERIMQISPILEKLGDQGGTLYLENFNTDNITITFEKDVIPDLGT